ncbi:MAG: radical SAM protein [Deltaproteobacteria bacterium]|nr:radical SAM protein [Deltaproteobacteria bacterium]
MVAEARKINPDTRVNFDTNGYMTERSLERVLSFATSITYDLKAYDNELCLALTGASAKPILRNAELVGRHAKEKLWEYRILVIPGINEEDIKQLTEFVADIDPSLPVCFLAFRPNFVLENHPGAGSSLMEKCVAVAKASGLKHAYWAGRPGIPGRVAAIESKVGDKYSSKGARLAASYAFAAGCQSHPRNCTDCTSNQCCPIKTYLPARDS